MCWVRVRYYQHGRNVFSLGHVKLDGWSDKITAEFRRDRPSTGEHVRNVECCRFTSFRGNVRVHWCWLRHEQAFVPFGVHSDSSTPVEVEYSQTVNRLPCPESAFLDAE